MEIAVLILLLLIVAYLRFEIWRLQQINLAVLESASEIRDNARLMYDYASNVERTHQQIIRELREAHSKL